MEVWHQKKLLIDLKFPFLEKTYDFWLDPDIPCVRLLREVYRVISTYEKELTQEEQEGQILCRPSDGSVCPPDSTLREWGVRSGETLMLV